MTAHENMSISAEKAARWDGIEPREFLPILMRQRRWAVATFAIVALITIVPLSRVKPQWEAQATIRVGRVFDALAGQVRPIEPIQEVLERMRAKSLLRDALRSDGASRTVSEGGQVEGTRVDLVPSTDLIRVTARASTADVATRGVTGIFDQLRSVHADLARATGSEVEVLAKEYGAEIASMREMQSNLQKAFSSASSPGVDDGATSLATITSIMERNAREMRELERQRFVLVRRNGYQSVPTEMIGEVSAVRLVSASRGLVVVFGAVMGLAAGLMVALVRDYVLRIRSQRLSP